MISRLEEAGATFLALPEAKWTVQVQSSGLSMIRTVLNAYNWQPPETGVRVPREEEIDSADEAMAWISLIPLDRYVLRKIVAMRSLVHPLSGDHLFPWKRLAVTLGADQKAVQRWHTQGIDIIVKALCSQLADCIAKTEVIND